MKAILTAALVLATGPALAQSTTASSPTGGSSKIVLFRGSSVVGAVVACPIRYDGVELVELGRGKYAEWMVQPGHYTLSNKSSSVDVPIGAGETKYVRCQIKMGFMAGKAGLELVPADRFTKNAVDYERKDILVPAESPR